MKTDRSLPFAISSSEADRSLLAQTPSYVESSFEKIPTPLESVKMPEDQKDHIRMGSNPLSQDYDTLGQGTVVQAVNNSEQNIDYDNIAVGEVNLFAELDQIYRRNQQWMEKQKLRQARLTEELQSSAVQLSPRGGMEGL